MRRVVGMSLISEAPLPAEARLQELVHSPVLLVLWDVDHTLVENAGVSKETYAAAFAALSGIEPRHAARTGGRTDRAIMHTMFADHALPLPPWSEVVDALQQAGAERYEAMRLRGSVLPGVRPAIDALGADPGVVQSVLTGNIQPNAEMKLAALDLADGVDLAVGAYGADADDRAHLVPVAQRRAAHRYRREFGRRNTVLIGDTPRDVDAGRRGGAHVVAVATGAHTVEELTRAGATVVMQDLSDTIELRRHLARFAAAA